MTKTIIFSAAVALGLFACGDDNKAPDAPRSIDAPGIDAPSFPAAPTLGTQIDRMGRPAINTALNHVFDGSADSKTAARDAYNADAGPSNWGATFGAEFAGNLAILDALDKGLLLQTTGTPLVAGVCSTTIATACGADTDCPTGEWCKVWHCAVDTATTCGRDSDCTAPDVCAGQACGNQVLYNGLAAGQRFEATTASYTTAAGLLTDDELYLDTTQTTCQQYLAVEFNFALPSLHLADCGGRAPAEDVMDLTYTLVAAGPSGLDQTTLAPGFGDAVGPHTDYTATFPYFGAPHQ
ncbi:MAG TPA: hypothetical protein VGF94_05960 [Kofleriaceae bacterium]|jgi:hypothetical protein